jgi:catechol 2,3-dioxygenase-like lactoylglutathione lyase family enzyme
VTRKPREASISEVNSSCISHVSLGTNRFEESRAFYEKVLAVLGCRIMLEHPGAASFGKSYPEFWIHAPIDGKKATAGNGVHVGFVAESKAEVDAFFKTALEAGATADGGPGHRNEYGEPYYGCFVRDLDGNKVEATFWDFELAKKLGMG